MYDTICEDWRLILRREFAGDDDGFVTGLQQDSRWDHERFRELAIAMREACLLCSEDEELERWVAHGFYYVPDFVRDWTQQENFPRPDSEYWCSALLLLDQLRCWFFWGEPPGDGELDFSPFLD